MTAIVSGDFTPLHLPLLQALAQQAEGDCHVPSLTLGRQDHPLAQQHPGARCPTPAHPSPRRSLLGRLQGTALQAPAVCSGACYTTCHSAAQNPPRGDDQGDISMLPWDSRLVYHAGPPPAVPAPPLHAPHCGCYACASSAAAAAAASAAAAATPYYAPHPHHPGHVYYGAHAMSAGYYPHHMPPQPHYSFAPVPQTHVAPYPPLPRQFAPERDQGLPATKPAATEEEVLDPVPTVPNGTAEYSAERDLQDTASALCSLQDGAGVPQVPKRRRASQLILPADTPKTRLESVAIPATPAREEEDDDEGYGPPDTDLERANRPPLLGLIPNPGVDDTPERQVPVVPFSEKANSGGLVVVGSAAQRKDVPHTTLVTHLRSDVISKAKSSKRIYLHKCPYCDTVMTLKSNMTAHMRIHSGEKPYVCSVADCGKSFKWKSSLSHHESLHAAKPSSTEEPTAPP